MTGTTNNDRSFTRRQRLVESAEFNHVFQGGNRSTDRFFTILYRDNEMGYPRLGFAVSKKRIRKAVGRNQIRRLTRESFRMSKARLGSVDVVVMARSAAATAANEDIFNSLQKHWRRMERNSDEIISIESRNG